MNRHIADNLENFLREIQAKSRHCPKLFDIFETCYRDALEKAVTEAEDNTAYVVTGDIPAMWLRDSAAQMRPYLFPAGNSQALQEMIARVVRRQFFYIGIDPYANAFNPSPNGACWEPKDLAANPWLWERKYELDSLCYPVQLAYLLWKNTGHISQFDEIFQASAEKILSVFRTEQYHEEKSDYRFVRTGTYHTETLSRGGKGSLTKPGIGLIWSGFRPSDDACTFGYLIPSNMFAAVVLRYLEEIERDIFHNAALAGLAGQIREEVENGIETYAKTLTKEFGMIYAYEVDGYGMFCLMDDANVPSLLSMDYLGYRKDRQTAENTRRFILSEANPFYYKGSAGAGIGSPHTRYGHIWHIAMAMQGLTADSPEEKRKILEQMAATTAGKNVMHESFSCENASVYTREWFSWANAMYAELFLDYLGYRVQITE